MEPALYPDHLDGNLKTGEAFGFWKLIPSLSLSLSLSLFRSLCTAVNTYYLSCLSCHNNCSHVLYSNKITFLMDLLLHQLTVSISGPILLEFA